ncbi:MAG: VOC family protein [Thermomicrobiales bacterium]
MTARGVGARETGLAAGEQPKRRPDFTETMQIGIVVRDLDATIKKYVDDYGIGPWQRHEKLTPENATDLRIYGQPAAPWRVAAASAMVDQVMWELIEPLDEESVFAPFLAEKGEGVHHIAVATPNFDEALAAQVERGNTLVLSGTFSGIDVAYLPTDRDLGVILEIFSGMPGAEQEPDAT